VQHDEDTVGVVVPMFNSERTIAATLKSICEQTHRRLDIVVVDDGSTDGSAAVVAACQARDPRVRLVSQANAGVAAARNKGAASTSANFIAFIDADDLWAPTKVEYQLAALIDGGEAVGAVYCWFATIDEADRTVSFGPHPEAEGRILRELCAVNMIGNGSSLMARRSAFEKAGGYDPSLRARGAEGAEDFLVCLRLAEHTEFAVVPRYLVGYRRVPGSMSSRHLRMFRSTELVLGEYRARFPDWADSIDDQVQNFRHWYAWGALRDRRMGDARVLVGECVAARPLAASLRFLTMGLETVKGRLFRQLHIAQLPVPLYTETLW
jgi:glycosyltransferase involved in cell wall biosynthesis